MSFRCSRDCDGPGCPACARIAKLEAQLAAAVAAEREACAALVEERNPTGYLDPLAAAIRARGTP